MEITIQIGGGFAALPNLQRPVTVDTATGDPQLSRELEALVRDAAFFTLPGVIDSTAPGAADHFTYTVTVRKDGAVHVVQVTDPIPDPALQRLVDRLVTHARTTAASTGP